MLLDCSSKRSWFLDNVDYFLKSEEVTKRSPFCVYSLSRVIMPTYEYECQSCFKRHDEIHGMLEHPEVQCSHCGGKCIQAFVANTGDFVLKGEGWASKKFRVADQMRKSQEVASKKQDINWGHLKNSTATPNFNGQITGEAGDPEAWRRAGKLAEEAGIDSSSFENKAKEVEAQQKLPEASKSIDSISSEAVEEELHLKIDEKLEVTTRD